MNCVKVYIVCMLLLLLIPLKCPEIHLKSLTSHLMILLGIFFNFFCFLTVLGTENVTQVQKPLVNT